MPASHSRSFPRRFASSCRVSCCCCCLWDTDYWFIVDSDRWCLFLFFVRVRSFLTDSASSALLYPMPTHRMASTPCRQLFATLPKIQPLTLITPEKYSFSSSCHRSKLIWHPFNLSYLFSSTFYSPQEYVTLLTTNYRELEAAIAKALDGKIQK